MKSKTFTKRILAVALSLIMVLGLMPMTVLASSTSVPGAEGHVLDNIYTGTFTDGYDSTILIYSTPGACDLPYTIYTITSSGGNFGVPKYDNNQWHFAGWKTWYKGSHSGAGVITSDKANPKFNDQYNYFTENADDGILLGSYPQGYMTVLKETLWKGTYYLSAVYEPLVTVNVGNGVSYTVSGASKRADNQYSTKYGSGLTINYTVDNKYIVSGVSANYGTDYSNDGNSVAVNSIIRPASISINTQLKQQNVSFDANGGEGAMSAQVFEHSVAQALTTNSFTKTGYTFAGWNTKADGTGTAYTDKQSVTFTPVNDGDSITLYAQWTECTVHSWENGVCAECGLGCVHDSYSYSASGNVITETCINGCGHSETAKLEYSTGNGTYSFTGLAIQPLKVTYSSGWQGGDLPITYSTNNTNVGTAKGVITINGVIAGQEFKITEADISGATVTVDPTSGIYTGSAHTPDVTVTLDGFGTLVNDEDYTLSWDKNGFTAPDTYTVTVNGTGNFTGTTTQTFNINAATLTDVNVAQVGTLTYGGGKTLTPTVSASAAAVNGQPVTFTYSTLQDGTYGTMPSFTNAGTYTVYFKAAAPNHNEATGSFTVTVDKIIVTEPVIASKVYNGSVQAADITVTDLCTVTKNNGGTGAGKYDVVLTLKDNANYKWATTEEATITLTFEITKAANEWTTEPTISGWTYGDTESTPNYAAKFGTVNILYSGTANDGTAWNSENAPNKAGNYTATFTVTGNDDYTALTKDVSFSIQKDTYDMSNVKWNYTEAFEYDGLEKTVAVNGLPDGVTVSGYTENKATVVGDYTAKVTLSYDSSNYNTPIVANLNWSIKNEWTPTEYISSTPNSNGWLNDTFVITAADGYKVSTTNTADGDWQDTLRYTEETADGSVTFYLKNEADGTISLAKTVTYKIDTTPATGTVDFVERKSWQEFVNTITFGLFYNAEVTVKAEATDDLSGIASIEYLESNAAMTLDEIKAVVGWKPMPVNGVGVTVEDAKQFVYFIRITDKAGNVTYLSTDGAEYDTTLPAISGIKNGETYYTTQVVTVEDKNLVSVELDGETVTLDKGTHTLAGNVEATYTIKVTDKAGNVTEYTVTMKTIAELIDSIDEITVDDVTSDDKEIIEQVIEDIDEQLANDDLTEDEKAVLEETKEKAQNLLDKIDGVAKATDTENTEKVKDVTAENVTPEDKTDLENAKADLEKALENNGSNYIENEKKAIENEIKRIDDALEVISNVEAVEELIDKLPDTIKKDDEAAIRAADKAYNALTDYEKSLVDANAKKALDDAKAALAELNKSADSTFPDTGDNTNIWMWFAVAFISGSLALTLGITEKKRRTQTK